MPSLNIIGAGRVATVLGRLWHENGQFQIEQVLNRSLASSREAVEFMGAGYAVSGWERLKPVDAWLIGTRDDAIWAASERLAEMEAAEAGQVVFHLSGARGSGSLVLLADKGLHTASLHPLNTFPDPLRGYQRFDGTWCALEGRDEALALLEPAVKAIGGHPFHIREQQKQLYHAANAILNNFMIVLMDLGLRVQQLAGIPAEQASRMVAPLLRETLENGLELGPEAALTGPVVRGDLDIVRSHLNVLPPYARDLYRALAHRTVQVALESGRLPPEIADEMTILLDSVMD